MKKSQMALALASVLVAACGSPFLDQTFFGSTPSEPAPVDNTKILLPNFGATRTLASTPPPISGGTLIALGDGRRVVASDPDRDRIYVVDIEAKSVKTITLLTHDEPGRLVEDADGHVHVVLRSGGAIVTVDVDQAVLVDRQPVCAAPRGITFDRYGKRLLVACESGELIALDPHMITLPTTLGSFGEGLRDVVTSTPPDALATSVRVFVSRFRTAEILELTAGGALVRTTRPSVNRENGPFNGGASEATLAWRMVAAPEGSPTQDPIVVHQLASLAGIEIVKGSTYYGVPDPRPDACSTSGVVKTAISQGDALFIAPDHVVLPVDIIASNGGFAVISAGNAHTPELPQVYELKRASCGFDVVMHTLPVRMTRAGVSAAGQATAIARLSDGSLLVQSREPAQLENLVTGDVIPLATDSREDTGHAIFHANSGVGIACASCHGEGGDDGHTWSFNQLGERRTPSLRGTLNGTAPYHWSGAMVDIGMLADEVLTRRLSGPQLSLDQKAALQTWLFEIPSPVHASSADESSAARGKILFESADAGCSSCHSGPRMTNDQTVDVGSGGSFQVPPLVGVVMRAPYMHNGCALTLRDRFGAPTCAGTKHGSTANLAPSDIDDLVSYLQTL
jgi:mono/diheme cytochrome c family protein